MLAMTWCMEKTQKITLENKKLIPSNKVEGNFCLDKNHNLSIKHDQGKK